MKNIFLAILILACKFSFAQNTKYDIAFVLRGYDSTCYYCDSIDFEPRAKYIVEHLNKLSFEQISTYRIFVNGIDSRSPVNLQSEKDINTLQASLDGWPGSQWDWLRNRTDFWLVVPDNYRPIIVNAIAWMRQTKLDFSSWGNQTSEGAQHYSTIQNNVVRMGPSSASEFLSGMKMPSNYNPYDFKYTEIVLNSKSNARISGGGAQSTLQYFGVLDSNGNPYNDFYLRCSYVYHSPRNRDFSTGIYTSIHEGIHALGMGTHDIDDSERNLSVMSSFGAIESFSMLPAWDRYYWTKWIPQSTITSDSTLVSDLKGVGRSVDKSKKYIYQVSAGDSLGRGGAYKEKYDGKWYSYAVDNGGTLRFNSAFTNNNRLAPINAYLDVPIVKKLGDTVSLYVNHDGSRSGFDSIAYKWYKDDILISVSNRFVINETELIINGVTINDVGLYKCVISNKYGTVTTKQIKLVINCGVSPQVTPNVFVCQNTGPVIVSAQANIGSTLLWYGSNASGGISSTTAPLISSTTPGANDYYVSQISTQGCESTRSKITVVVNGLPAAPVVSNLAYCAGSTTIALTATALSGHTLSWYGTNATGGTASSTSPTPSSAAASTTDYYVSQINTQGCESARSKITVVVNALPAAPVVSNLAYCAGSTTTALTATALSGHTLSWYGTNATGGTTSSTPPTPSASATGTTDYYVSQINTQGCESTRSKITVVVNALPAAPVVSNLAYCAGSTTTALTATALSGHTLSWYGTNATGGTASSTPTTPSSAAASTTDYYVSQVSAQGCESARSKITVVVNALPAAPVVSNSTYCIGSTTIALSATALSGNTLRWYGTNATGGTASSTPPTPSASATGTTDYYVSQVSAQGCESIRGIIKHVVNPLPVKPVISWSGVQFSTTATGVNYQWLLNGAPIFGATASTHKPLNTGDFKLRITDPNGCINISDSFKLVVTAINNLVATPVSNIAMVYPNPASTQLVLEFATLPTINLNFQLVSPSGKVLSSTNGRNKVNVIDVSKLESGSYFIRVIGKKYDQVKKVLIKK